MHREWLAHVMFGKNQYNIVKQLASNKQKLKKKKKERKETHGRQHETVTTCCQSEGGTLLPCGAAVWSPPEALSSVVPPKGLSSVFPPRGAQRCGSPQRRSRGRTGKPCQDSEPTGRLAPSHCLC